MADESDDGLGARRREHRDTVAGSHTEPGEVIRMGAREGVELAESVRAPRHFESRVARAGDERIEQARDGVSDLAHTDL